MNSKNISVSWYISNRPIFKRLAYKVESILIELFDINNISYHMVTSRVKDIDSFEKKISGDRYSDPTKEVQDLAGIRIITYVEDEIQKICDVIEKTFDIDWDNSSDKSESLAIDKVGYRSVHYVAKLKTNRIELPEYQQFKDLCFEIQIRTILQHAWAEIEHDRNYKYSGKLPSGISRRFKLLAGSLEMADREFNNISREIDDISKEVKAKTEKGNLNIELNSTSLSQFIKTRFKELYIHGFKIRPNSNDLLLKEMNDFGLNTLKDFDSIIKNNFIENYIKYLNDYIDLTEMGIVRTILIIHDYKKYFEEAHKGNFTVLGGSRNSRSFFKQYGIDWEKDIESIYEVPIE